MQKSLYTRKGIPFFYDKSEKEIQQDPYERFDPMVLRQSALHLADEIWEEYPFSKIMKFSERVRSEEGNLKILEIGCGVGRWIADFADRYPNAECWGIDYSYQMLKRAHEFWINGDQVHLNLSRYGFSSTHQISGKPLKNLQLGLAKAEALPFSDTSQDIILNSFLLDRLGDPMEGLKEMHRILKPEGQLIMVSPLNFSQAKHWDQFYPAIKIYQLLTDLGFTVLDWAEDMIIKEPLDRHGNIVQWKCIAVHAQKNQV